MKLDLSTRYNNVCYNPYSISKDDLLRLYTVSVGFLFFIFLYLGLYYILANSQNLLRIAFILSILSIHFLIYIKYINVDLYKNNPLLYNVIKILCIILLIISFLIIMFHVYCIILSIFNK